MATKYRSVKTCAKGKARSSNKRIGTRGATFKDAPRPKSSPMTTRYVEPVQVEPVQSWDTGSTNLSLERGEVSRKEVPIDKVPWVYKERTREVTDVHGTVRTVTDIVDRPARGYSAGALSGRKMDKRTLSRRYDVGRSDKASIGKTIPTTDKTPFIERVKD